MAIPLLLRFLPLEAGPIMLRPVNGYHAASRPAEAAALGRLLEGWAETFPDLITDFGDSTLDEETRGQAVEQLKALGYL